MDSRKWKNLFFFICHTEEGGGSDTPFTFLTLLKTSLTITITIKLPTPSKKEGLKVVTQKAGTLIKGLKDSSNYKHTLNPVLFMSLFGHALFNYNPPKRSREVW